MIMFVDKNYMILNYISITCFNLEYCLSVSFGFGRIESLLVS